MKKHGSNILHDRKSNYFLRTLLIVILVVGLTTLAAVIWQRAEDAKYEDGTRTAYSVPKEIFSFISTLDGLLGGDDSSSKAEDDPSSADSAVPVSSSESAVESDAESGSSEAVQVTEAEPEQEPLLNGLVPESAAVDETYFNDAVFIGDSLTEGIKAYALMENATVLAHQGINVDSILTKEAISYGGGRITIPEALLRMDKVGKLYVMIGANGIAWMDNATFIKKYGSLIDELKECQPGAAIYVQSMLPVNEQIIIDQEQYEPISNQSIDALNEKLLALTIEKGVFYIDLAEAFKDGSGGMPAEATPDGIHLNAPYYQTWFDYLMAHTVSDASDKNGG